jgi:hypothetical protein
LNLKLKLSVAYVPGLFEDFKKLLEAMRWKVSADRRIYTATFPELIVFMDARDVDKLEEGGFVLDVTRRGNRPGVWVSKRMEGLPLESLRKVTDLRSLADFLSDELFGGCGEVYDRLQALIRPETEEE